MTKLLVRTGIDSIKCKYDFFHCGEIQETLRVRPGSDRRPLRLGEDDLVVEIAPDLRPRDGHRRTELKPVFGHGE